MQRRADRPAAGLCVPTYKSERTGKTLVRFSGFSGTVNVFNHRSELVSSFENNGVRYEDI